MSSTTDARDDGPSYRCVRFGCETPVPPSAFVCDHHLYVHPPGDDDAEDDQEDAA